MRVGRAYAPTCPNEWKYSWQTATDIQNIVLVFAADGWNYSWQLGNIRGKRLELFMAHVYIDARKPNKFILVDVWKRKIPIRYVCFNNLLAQSSPWRLQLQNSNSIHFFEKKLHQIDHSDACNFKTQIGYRLFKKKIWNWSLCRF